MINPGSSTRYSPGADSNSTWKFGGPGCPSSAAGRGGNVTLCTLAIEPGARCRSAFYGTFSHHKRDFRSRGGEVARWRTRHTVAPGRHDGEMVPGVPGRAGADVLTSFGVATRAWFEAAFA